MVQTVGILSAVFGLHGIDRTGGADRHEAQKRVLLLLKAPSPQIGAIPRQTVLPPVALVIENGHGLAVVGVPDDGFQGIEARRDFKAGAAAVIEHLQSQRMRHGGEGHRRRLRQFRPYGGGLLRRQVLGKGGRQAGRIARRFALLPCSWFWRIGLRRQAAIDHEFAVIIEKQDSAAFRHDFRRVEGGAVVHPVDAFGNLPDPVACCLVFVRVLVVHAVFKLVQFGGQGVIDGLLIGGERGQFAVMLAEPAALVPVERVPQFDPLPAFGGDGGNGFRNFVLRQFLQQLGIENVAAVACIKKIAPDLSPCVFIRFEADEPHPFVARRNLAFREGGADTAGMVSALLPDALLRGVVVRHGESL